MNAGPREYPSEAHPVFFVSELCRAWSGLVEHVAFHLNVLCFDEFMA